MLGRLSFKAAKWSTRSFSTYPAFINNTPVTEVSKITNGVTVASETAHGETATVGVWIDAGSRYETAKNNGAAHFLEHMAFKGTKNRTQKGLEVEIENMGAHLNAYTSREQTVYYAKCFKDDVPRCVEILADILQNSLLDDGAIKRERDVILRESEEVNKDYQEVILDELHATAFSNQGLGRTILGPEENIKTLTRDDLKGYINTHYTGNRFVIAGGDRSSSNGRNSSRFATAMTSGDHAQSFMTFNTCYKDTGLFGIYLVTENDKLRGALNVTVENLVRLCHNVSDEEVDRAKTSLKANMLMQLDSFSNVAEDIGRQMLTYGRRMSAAETFARIDCLTTDDVKKTANKIINDEDHALAGVGNILNLPDYKTLRSKNVWMRG